MGRAATAVVPPNRGRTPGRYELFEQLAVGGMAVIYRGHDQLLRRDVAYKRLQVPTDNSRARVTAMFQREYDTLAGLPHPNIVEVYDYGIDSEGPFYAMELLSGQDLSKLALLPIREACRLLRDVASALALVHARRLVHRDLSPNNVRLTKEGRAKLLDFGALMPFGKPRELIGTPAFLAPECLSDSVLDQRSDLYSLGAVAYWALTRRTVVAAQQLDDLFEAWSEPLVPPSVHVPNIPPELDTLIVSLLSHDPLARPQSAAYVIERLTAIADLPPETDERRVAYSYLAHPPLSGRADLMGSLKMAVESASEGQGQAVRVEAGPGLGRSALLDALATHAQLSGATVLRAKADPSSAPFGVARSLMHVALALYPDLEDLNARESFQTFMPGSIKERVRSGVEIAERHAAVITGVQNALLEMATRNPLVIVVDDLHLVDAESMSLFGSLTEVVRAHRIALIVSVLAEHERANTPAFTRIEASTVSFQLAPLSPQQTAELIDAVFGDVPNSRRLASWLFEQSGGNPASIIDLSRVLLDRSLIKYTLGTFTLPHDVSTDLSVSALAIATTQRLDVLEPLPRLVATILSLGDGPLSVGLVADVAEAEPGDVMLAADELAMRGIAVRDGTSISMLGANLQKTVRASLDDTQRRALNVRIARALLAIPDGTLDTTFAACTHLLRAGEDDEAAELMAQAVAGPIGGETAARWTDLFEKMLVIYDRQNRSKEQRLSLLIPLGMSGFWSAQGVQTRHLEPALKIMASVCGMAVATRVRPWLGKKLALVTGLMYAAVRRGMVPQRERLGTVRTMLADFIGLISSGIASAASAFDGPAALRMSAMLEPLDALPPNTPAALARQFCLATAELAAARFAAASARYAQFLPVLAEPIPGFADDQRRPIYLGCLNGRAQAEATRGSPLALEIADELGRGDPFFAPHAECARMTYFGHRGEMDKAEVHRARAELFALQGGNSWSAVTVLTVRRMCIACATYDSIALVQTIAELDRLTAIAPSLRTMKAMAEAWLEYLRGRPERAVASYERSIETDDAKALPTHYWDLWNYATALNGCRQFARAKQVCSSFMQRYAQEVVPASVKFGMRIEFAHAEAGLGNQSLACELMETLMADAEEADNPLVSGMLYRARAQLAIQMRDLPAFDEAFAVMSQQFGATRNPSLLRLCAALLSEAQRAGLRGRGRANSPSEQEDLDGNTQMELETKERSTLRKLS